MTFARILMSAVILGASSMAFADSGTPELQEVTFEFMQRATNSAYAKALQRYAEKLWQVIVAARPIGPIHARLAAMGFLHQSAALVGNTDRGAPVATTSVFVSPCRGVEDEA